MACVRVCARVRACVCVCGRGLEVVTSACSLLFEEKDELLTAETCRSSAEERRVFSRPVDEETL